MIDFVRAYLHDEKCGGHQFQEEHTTQPVIGEKYLVIYYCDRKHPLNYIVEVTAENIDEIKWRMNSPTNDTTDYELIVE